MAFEIVVEESVNYSIITLRNTETKTEAELYSFGALLNAFRIPLEQATINVVWGYDSPSDAKQNIAPFFRSAKLSPFVCRLKNGVYDLDGVAYKIEKNYLHQHAIHGLMYDAIFEIKESRTDQESASVLLYSHYDGSDNGYPFEFDLYVEWKLSEENMLSVKTTVEHTNEFAIPYADGWHPYFSLDTNIDECYLQVDSKKVLECDAEMIPTGNVIANEKYSKKVYLRDVSLDDCFVLNDHLSQPKCILSSEKVRLTIMPEASYPYLQIFTPGDRKSIALESISGAPDCFNNKMGLVMIQPNEVVSFTTHYILETL